MTSSELKFRPRARLIRTIGDRLISGPEAAVIELVKNAHDADASYVQVIFQPPLVRGQGCIVVEDDGHGMTLSDVEEKWMEPATSDKVLRHKSPKGRPLLGSKGIGRFAAAKLGRYIAMVTTAQLSTRPPKFQSTLLPELDWDRFEENTYLSEISFPIDTMTSDAGSCGTRLEIKHLRDTWTEKSIRALYQEMRRLISPLEEAHEVNFRIYLDLSACTQESCGFDGASIVNSSLPSEEDSLDPHRVRPFPILRSCDYEVVGSFEPRHAGADKQICHFEGTLTIHRGGLKPESISLDIPIRTDLGEHSFGTSLIHLFIFDRDATALRASMNRAGMGDLSASKAREILDGVTGVAIYRDKFRIRPYGDSDKDWLTLDTRRVQFPTLRIGHNQVSGIIIVGPEHDSGLIEQSSREGLEANGSFQLLQRSVLELFAVAIEPRRIKFREDAELGRTETDTFKDAFRSAELGWVSKIIESLPDKERTHFEALAAKEGDRLRGYLKKLEEKQVILEAKVTLGLIIGEVLHEGRAPVAFIQHEANRLTRWWRQLFDGTEEAVKLQAEVPSILRGMVNSGERLRLLFSALEPLSGARRGMARLFSPRQVVLDVVKLFEGRIQKLGVDVSCKSSFDDDLVGHPQDLSVAITNIIDNSLYWFEHHQTEHPELKVRIYEEGACCVIDLIDNGPGIPAEFRNRIFDVGFTLKPFGTGLGLNIALEAIGRSDGTISLIETEVGTGFRLSVPTGKGKK